MGTFLISTVIVVTAVAAMILLGVVRGFKFPILSKTRFSRSTELNEQDLQENIHRTKTLAVALAFAVSAADKK
ncbi:unnamed protein product, partial [marine sediment metagenome]